MVTNAVDIEFGFLSVVGMWEVGVTEELCSCLCIGLEGGMEMITDILRIFLAVKQTDLIA